MPTYAAETQVPSERSRAEIERTIARYGAQQFAYGWDHGRHPSSSCGRGSRARGSSRAASPGSPSRRSDMSTDDERPTLKDEAERLLGYWERHGSDPEVVARWAVHDMLDLARRVLEDIYGMTDQPTECPRCGARTEFTEQPDGTQLHECPRPSCRYRFYVEEDD